MRKYLPLIVICLAITINLFGQPKSSQPVDPKRESPQATLKTFTNAFKQPRVGVSPDPIDEAVHCLDLEEFSKDFREAKGFELASELLEIVDTIENFHIEEVPNSNSGEPYLIYRSQIGEIVIAKQPNGEWLFTKETIRSVPLIMVGIHEEKTNLGSATLTHSDSVGSQIRDKMPDVLKQKTLSLERWQWLGLFVLLILGLIFAFIARTVISWILGKILRKRYAFLTDDDVKILYAPIGLLAFVVAFRTGLRALSLTQSSLGFLRTVMFILTAVAIVWLAYRIVNAIAERLQKRALETESQADDLLVPFLSVIIRIGIVFSGIIIVAENLNFNVTGLIAGLGIGGIAIALASQETLSNFFGSLVLMVERPFMADDKVTVGGVEGTVKEVGIRSTKIQTFDDSIVTVPNSSIVKANIVNDGLQRYRSWVVKLSVPYQNGTKKIEEFCKGIEDIIKNSKCLNKEVYNLHIYDIVLPSVIIRVELNFTKDNFEFEMDGRQQFIMDVLRLADKLEIELKAK
jgi:MscS family membrane protein